MASKLSLDGGIALVTGVSYLIPRLCDILLTVL